MSLKDDKIRSLA